MTLWIGHSKLFNYPSSLLPQAPEPASKQMHWEADPELEKVCLCHGEKPLGITINTMHVHLLLERILSFQLIAVNCSIVNLTFLMNSHLLVLQQKDLLKQVILTSTAQSTHNMRLVGTNVYNCQLAGKS